MNFWVSTNRTMEFFAQWRKNHPEAGAAAPPKQQPAKKRRQKGEKGEKNKKQAQKPKSKQKPIKHFRFTLCPEPSYQAKFVGVDTRALTVCCNSPPRLGHDQGKGREDLLVGVAKTC